MFLFLCLLFRTVTFPFHGSDRPLYDDGASPALSHRDSPQAHGQLTCNAYRPHYTQPTQMHVNQHSRSAACMPKSAFVVDDNRTRVRQQKSEPCKVNESSASGRGLQLWVRGLALLETAE